MSSTTACLLRAAPQVRRRFVSRICSLQRQCRRAIGFLKVDRCSNNKPLEVTEPSPTPTSSTLSVATINFVMCEVPLEPSVAFDLVRLSHDPPLARFALRVVRNCTSTQSIRPGLPVVGEKHGIRWLSLGSTRKTVEGLRAAYLREVMNYGRQLARVAGLAAAREAAERIKAGAEAKVAQANAKAKANEDRVAELELRLALLQGGSSDKDAQRALYPCLRVALAFRLPPVNRLETCYNPNISSRQFLWFLI